MTAITGFMTLIVAAVLAPDTIYYNGKIVTVNTDFDIVEAVAIRDGRFVAVGTDDEVRGLASETTRQVDLRGQTVLPGLYDNHIHLGPGRGIQKWEEGYIPAVAEWSAAADTMEKLLAALADQARTTPKGEWIQGGLTRPDWPNHKIPTSGCPTDRTRRRTGRSLRCGRR